MRTYEFVYFGETEDDFGDAVTWETEIPDSIYEAILKYKLDHLDEDYYEDSPPDEEELQEDNVDIDEIPGLEAFKAELLNEIRDVEKDELREREPDLSEEEIETKEESEEGRYRVYDKHGSFYALYYYDKKDHWYKCEKMFIDEPQHQG